tara:strand:- start:5570 stop:5947 length:378 start_codon:yes stop_codon:yes gene_type:complete
MTVDFPAISPTQRSYTPGEYPTKRFTSISGAGTTRLYGSKAFNATLGLVFLQDDAGTQSILKSWHESYGGARILTLPATIFEGMNGPEEQIPSYLNWRWESVPVVQSLFPGRSKIQVALVATLDD